MNIVVDTNIVFSAIWNTNGKIANIITRRTALNLYSPAFLLIELSEHRNKLMDKLQIDTKEFLELQHITTRRITFIEEGQFLTRTG